MVNRLVPIRLKLGEKQAGTLKDFRGTLTCQLLTPTEPLLVVDDVQKATGRTVKGKEGGSLCVLGLDKLDNGDVQLQVRMANLPGEPLRDLVRPIQMRPRGPGGVVRLRRTGGNPSVLPVLLDAKGRSFTPVQIPRRLGGINNGDIFEDVTIVFRPQPGQDEPTRLIVSGKRLVTIPLAFNLVDVPLR